MNAASPSAPVRRPAMLSSIVAACAGAFAFALAGLADLRQEAAIGPQVIAVEAVALEDALADAPFLMLSESAAEVWVLTAPDCAPCRRLEREALARLGDAGVNVHVMLAPAKETDQAAPETLAFVAALARRQGAQGYAACLADTEGEAAEPRIRPAACRPGPDLGGPTLEGYLEWSRASQARITAVLEANGLEGAAPALIWRRGAEWRIARGADGRGVRAALKDLTLGA